MKRKIMVVGYGNVGRVTARMIVRHTGRVLVLDRKKPEVLEEGIEFIEGDALDEHIWRTLDLKEFELIIMALPNDIDTIFTTLIVKNLFPEITVIARANAVENVEKIYRAGADYVAPLSSISAQMLSGVLLRGRELSEEVKRVHEGVEIGRHTVEKGNPMEGKTLKEIGIHEKTGCLVIGIQDRDGKLLDIHPETVIEEGMTLAVLGTKEQIKEFHTKFCEVS
jgi:Trk K+ transport system NAD-binding subunit